VKPVAMVADATLDCSARGEIVLDAFLGSDTTVIAAERTGRRCYGLELDPAYVDTIVRRWQTLTPAAILLMTSPARRRPPMPRDKDDNYEVGYGKPPRETRFVKGQSGNPRGRPPGAKNFKTLLSEGRASSRQLHDEARMHMALEEIANSGGSFLVAVRIDAAGRVRALNDIPVPRRYSRSLHRNP
jgi:hypothetical protein